MHLGSPQNQVSVESTLDDRESRKPSSKTNGPSTDIECLLWKRFSFVFATVLIGVAEVANRRAGLSQALAEGKRTTRTLISGSNARMAVHAWRQSTGGQRAGGRATAARQARLRGGADARTRAERAAKSEERTIQQTGAVRSHRRSRSARRGYATRCAPSRRHRAACARSRMRLGARRRTCCTQVRGTEVARNVWWFSLSRSPSSQPALNLSSSAVAAAPLVLAKIQRTSLSYPCLAATRGPRGDLGDA